jgi:hypothetical protein
VLRGTLLAPGPVAALAVLGADEAKPLAAEEARKPVGKTVTVEMRVRAAKDRLEKRGEIYLAAREDFRGPRNFAVVSTRTEAAAFKDKGIADPAGQFRGKVIRATGKVKEVQQVPRIEVDDPTHVQLRPPDRPPGP